MSPPPASGQRVVRLTLGYRGDAFAGWARQSPTTTHGLDTVQDVLEHALTDVLGQPTTCTAAGRTDAGVHAEGQVVSFATSSTIPPDGLRRVLTGRLPDDVWVVDAADALPGFDARRDARRRWYRYAIWRGDNPPAIWRGRALPFVGQFDLGAVRRAARLLLGQHDLTSLAAAGSVMASPRRTIFAADWLELGPRLVQFEVCADGFLKRMVRTIVGSLLRVGEGAWTVQRFAAAMAAHDRRAAGPTAPALGLTLTRVEYG
ncbi:MAG: tRNA pseudouridine(38-40) synthase TruA [Chloroflexi bacterium]|nr:tRNA pseudouridine(38-40) synthase TruA [Chloroflexota bacterium]